MPILVYEDSPDGRYVNVYDDFEDFLNKKFDYEEDKVKLLNSFHECRDGSYHYDELELTFYKLEQKEPLKLVKKEVTTKLHLI